MRRSRQLDSSPPNLQVTVWLGSRQTAQTVTVASTLTSGIFISNDDLELIKLKSSEVCLENAQVFSIPVYNLLDSSFNKDSN